MQVGSMAGRFVRTGSWNVCSRSSCSTPSMDHRAVVLERARRLVEDRCAVAESKIIARARAASVTRSLAANERAAALRERNRATETRTEWALAQRAAEQRAREEREAALLRRHRAALARHEKGLDFRRLHTAQNIVMSSQRARVNRSNVAQAAEERRREEERRDEARRAAAEEAFLSRVIREERRRLVHDERALRSVMKQMHDEEKARERALARMAAHEKRVGARGGLQFVPAPVVRQRGVAH